MGLEAEDSYPSSTEVKNECSYTSTPPYTFMVCACAGTSLPLPLVWLNMLFQAL